MSPVLDRAGSGARPAAAGSASARPPDTSSGGKMPWASARSSAIAALHVALDLVDHRHRVGRVVLDGVVGEAELDGERDEVLLGAVVQVALELAPLGVAGGDDAGPRVLQLLVALRSSSRLACSAVSSCTLCSARPIWRASSVSTRVLGLA